MTPLSAYPQSPFSKHTNIIIIIIISDTNAQIHPTHCLLSENKVLKCFNLTPLPSSSSRRLQLPTLLSSPDKDSSKHVTLRRSKSRFSIIYYDADSNTPGHTSYLTPVLYSLPPLTDTRERLTYTHKHTHSYSHIHTHAAPHRLPFASVVKDLCRYTLSSHLPDTRCSKVSP